MKDIRRFRLRSGVFVLGLLLAGVAHASIAVLVEEPYGKGSGMEPAGHSAIYFDHICAASPTELRPCRDGELGAVISRYDGIANYDWLAIPLVPYLYAVDSADRIPATIDKATEDQMRDAYRRKHLMDVAPDAADGTVPKGNWYELIGSAYDRNLYGFQVKTTAEQDAGLIAMFNDRTNVEKFNGAFRNCADFARVTINRYYPKAIHRNFIADLGMTTPKQVAHALTKFGEKHPEAELRVFKVLQVEGTLPRSHKVKGFSESMVTSKRYVVPLTAIQPVATAAFLVAYLGKGRFAMPKNAPVLSLEPGSVAPQEPGDAAATPEAQPGVEAPTRTLLTPEP